MTIGKVFVRDVSSLGPSVESVDSSCIILSGSSPVWSCSSRFSVCNTCVHVNVCVL